MNVRQASFDEGCNSSLQGHVTTTYSQLVHVFGEPRRDCGPKVLANWSLVFADGTYASVYLWKYSSIPRHAHDWNIGGHSQAAVECVLNVLAEGTKLTVAPAPQDIWTKKEEELHNACVAGNVLAVEKLIAAGANPDSRPPDPLSSSKVPLNVAIENGHYNVVKVLLDAGADVNAGWGIRLTPLHKAAALADEKTVRLLLKHGANASASRGVCAAAKWARRFKNDRVADLIEARTLRDTDQDST